MRLNPKEDHALLFSNTHKTFNKYREPLTEFVEKLFHKEFWDKPKGFHEEVLGDTPERIDPTELKEAEV